jgi:MFS family permease
MSNRLGNLVIPSFSKIFYGYWVLFVAFFGIFVFGGCGVGAFSLFVQPLQAEFNWTRGEIMFGFSIFFLLNGLASPFIGGLVDRYGVRGVVAIGAVISGFGLASLYRLESIAHFYIAYALVGVSMAAIAQVPASAVVSNWFEKRRGTAIGIMASGIGIGILALGPFIGAFILPAFGWRTSYLALAIITWVMVPLALFVLRSKPSDMGLFPDGIKPVENVKAHTQTDFTPGGLTLQEAYGTSAFWLIALVFFIVGHSSLGVFHSQVPHLQDIGFPMGQAAAAMASYGIGSTIGKLFFGWLCDRIKAKHATAISFSLLSIGTILLMCVKPTSHMPLIWLYSIILGIGAGGWLPNMSMLTTTYFGLKSYGAIFGMVSLANGIGGAIGPFLAGYIYDTIHSYHLSFGMFLATFVVAILIVRMLRHSKKHALALK